LSAVIQNIAENGSEVTLLVDTRDALMFLFAFLGIKRAGYSEGRS
jgi:hypothetical protein